MRVMIVGDAIWHETGYGRQVRSLATRLAADGHEVLQFAPGGFYGGKVEYAPGITVLSSQWGDDRWGNGTFVDHTRKYKPDLIVATHDPQGYFAYGYESAPMVMWVPTDTWPVPKQERGILSRADKLLVPSQWGRLVLEQANFMPEYVPYGVEASEFVYRDEGRATWRRRMGVSDSKFLIGMVGINSASPDRKGYSFAFQAFRELLDLGVDFQVYIHGNAQGIDGAPNLDELREELVLERVVMLEPPRGPEYMSRAELADLLSSFDVLLQASMTEGFGLPVIEAQLMGTPVVANAATSVTELLGPNCIPCAPAGSMYMQTSTRISLPSPEKLADGLRQARAEWLARGMQRLPIAPMREWVLSQFDWDMLYDRHWRPLLAGMPAPVDHSAGERKLNLGCGRSPKEGFVNHDRWKHSPHVDVGHDLTEFPWPWEDNSFDYIEMVDVIEHLRGDVTDVMDELWRITAPGGWVYIHTCEANSWMHPMDPTHVRGFSLESFDYYDPETKWGQTYGIYSKHAWKISRRILQQGSIEIIMTPRHKGRETVTMAGGGQIISDYMESFTENSELAKA